MRNLPDTGLSRYITNCIRSAVKDEGLTQRELAERLNIAQQNVSDILIKNSHNWMTDNLAKWARALGYRIEIKFVKLPKEDQTK